MLGTEADYGGSNNINTISYLDNDSVYFQDISPSEPSIEIPRMPTELENFQFEFVDRNDQLGVRNFIILIPKFNLE